MPRIIGGALEVYSQFDAYRNIKPLVGICLLIIGLLILRKLFHRKEIKLKANVALLGGVSVFLDAVGGGGWGPVVTSTLVAHGNKPRLTIGC